MIEVLDNSINSLMIVGHNPTLTDFVNYFLVPSIDGLPTSAIVGLQFDTQKWENFKKADCTTKFVVFPKLL